MAERGVAQGIAADLRRAILAGQMEAGARLPSERTLAAQYGTGRTTVRDALVILREEGLVEPQHGRGVYVRTAPPLRRIAGDRYARRHREAGKAPYATEAAAQGRRPRVEVVSIEPEPAPDWVAERLGLAAGDRVLCRRNKYHADDRPNQLADTYIPWSIAEGSALLEEVPAAGGIYAELERLGYPLGAITEDVTARMPRPDEAEALSMRRGVPVMEVVHLSMTSDNTPFEVTKNVLPADLNMLSYSLPTE